MKRWTSRPIDLKGSISKLEVQIADTQKKLAASEGDKAFLEKELQRLMAEKAELERQFNDLARSAHAGAASSRRNCPSPAALEWIRAGPFCHRQDQKGAQKLMQGANAGVSKPAPDNNYDLNVEVKSDGSVQVIPPVTNSAPTNAAPASIRCRRSSNDPRAACWLIRMAATLRDLRVSVTDRCNFRCLYCLPETEAAQNFYRGRWATLPAFHAHRAAMAAERRTS